MGQFHGRVAGKFDPDLQSKRIRQSRANPALRKAVCESLEPRRLLSTYTVTSLADDGSTGTLRSVLANAEMYTGAQTIVFDGTLTADGSKTLTLDGLALEVSDTIGSITIQGPSNHRLTIAQNNNTFYTVGDFGTFEIDSGATVTLDDLNINGGYKSPLRDLNLNGGAIDSAGTLTVNDCTITGGNGSLGGGIYESGTDLLTVQSSTITGNSAGEAGGGIFATNLRVDSSTISDNYGGASGGGIGVTGEATITNSTINGNIAEENGGGISAGYDSTVLISNCTVTQNLSDGGSGVTMAGGTILNSTITGNTSPDYGAGGYAINSTSLTLIQGSILSDNGCDLGGGGEVAVCNDIFSSNFSDVQNLVNFSPNFDGYADNVIWGYDPTLAPLGWYGGPTQTMPPLDAPQVGAGSTIATTPSLDQRGFPMGTDYGAFQTQSSPLEVNTASDGPTSAGQLSLRDAVNLASVTGGDQTVTFDPSLTAGGAATINLNDDAVELDDTTGTVTIDGTGSSITVNAPAGQDAFTVDAGSNAAINAIAINGDVSTSGTLSLAGGTIAAGGTFSATVLTGGTLNLPDSITLSSLDINPGGIARQTCTDTTFGSEVLTVGSLTIDDPSGTTNGGVLDLGNGDLIARDTDSSGIQPLLAAGYDGGAWDGEVASGPNPAAIVSSAAASDPYQIEALGYAEIGTATDQGQLNLESFDGQTVNTGDTVVALTYYGDANLDRQVNSTDYSLIGSVDSYTSFGAPGWTDGNFTFSGFVNVVDGALFTSTVALLAASPKYSATPVTIDQTGGKTSGTSDLSNNVPAIGTTVTLGNQFLEGKNNGADTDVTGDFTLGNVTTDAAGNQHFTVNIAAGATVAKGDYLVFIQINGGATQHIVVTVK